MRGRFGSAALMLAALGALCTLGLRHREEVSAAVAAVPGWAVAAAVALHLATLVVRSEAWRVTLASAGADRLSRGAIHGANAAAFVVGTLQSQLALPARVAMLRRLGGPRAPGIGVICVADVPIFCLELCATALLLCAAVLAGTGAIWMAPAAAALTVAVLAAVLLARARLEHRATSRGLAVFADRERRGTLVALVACMVALSAGRMWVVLLACGLPHGLGAVAVAFAALGVFGLLPIGPGAPPSALLAATGGASAGASIAGGLMLGASSIVAVALYALLVGVLLAPRRGGDASGRGARSSSSVDQPKPRAPRPWPVKGW